MFLNLPLSLASKFNCSAKVIKVGVANEDVTCRILTMKGPYTTACRTYTSFSSHCCPNVNLVQKSTQDLVAAGLGIFKVINKLKSFYKMLPSDDLQQKLAKYNISAQDYRTTFLKDDNKLTASNIFTMSEGHPFQAELNAFRERATLLPLL